MAVLTFTGSVPPSDVRITQFNIYKKAAAATAFTRLAQIPVQLEYNDPTAAVGDAFYFTYFDPVRFAESGPSPIIAVMDSTEAVTVSGFLIGTDMQPPTPDTLGPLQVRILLKGLSGSTPVADNQIITSIEQVITVNSDGSFFFVVAANDRIFPSGTFYQIELLDRRYFKTVSRAKGDGQLLALLQDVPPLELR